MRIALFDLSGIFRLNWHATEHQEIGEAFKRTLAFVHGNRSDFDAAGVCIDKPPYKRKEMLASYKAQREAAPEAMHEQQRAVIERLDKDGVHIFGADGYEADDIIATLTVWATKNGHDVSIYSADKDMMQLVSERVCVVSHATKQKYGVADVKEKFGVPPDAIPDLLALAGDSADNIPGIKGCGIKTAAGWLAEHGSLFGILDNVAKLPERFRPLVEAAREELALSRKLTTLMTDAPIRPEAILETKEEKPEAPEQKPEVMTEMLTPEPGGYSMTLAVPQQQELAKPAELAPTDWNRALEPRDAKQAWGMAVAIHKSRLFGDFPNPEAILAVMMAGRSFGLDAVASLRGFHVIKGKASPSAQTLIGLVKRSHLCEYFRLVETTNESATWETKRRDEPSPTKMTFTIRDADRAGISKNDQWMKRPGTMCRWRSGTELARAVYPDIVAGLYTQEELEDM